jgi:RND family efflux transporter MFP subunit
MMPSLRIAVLALVTIPLAAGLPGAGARAGTDPSVLVQLTTLQKGSLPRVVTGYGRVQPSTSASRMVMAPLAGVVEQVDVRSGETVAQDAPLLRLAPSPATIASYTQAASALRVATDLVSRTGHMVAQHLATAQQLADAEKAESDARATLDALKAQGADGPKTLRAPFQAIVTTVSVTPGAIVGQGSALVQLTRPHGLVLQVGLVPAEAASIVPNDKASVIPVGGGATLEGTVSMRGSVIQAADGLVPIDVTVPAGQMFVGEMAEARITTGEVTGYVVPHAAILVNDQGQDYVVQSVKMTAKQVPVHVLCVRGDQDVIAGALDPSAPVVLAGNHQLEDGMRMRVAEAAGRSAP